IWPLLFPHDKVTQTTAFGGMSGVVYGLLGYLWMKSWFQPQLKLFVSNGIVLFLVGWLVLGWTGLLDQLVGSSVANWAHTVGLLAGMAVGFAPVAWRRATGK
ncbi:MAG TPA: rhomboid family intramembrane serine protease, partial [Pirellulales bacterium]|nr:rhomboid family intramembrane serine protease [Pirellulales bacterium]